MQSPRSHEVKEINKIQIFAKTIPQSFSINSVEIRSRS